MNVTDGLVHAVHQLERQCCCAVLMPAQRSTWVLELAGADGSSLMPEERLLWHTLACSAHTEVRR